MRWKSILALLAFVLFFGQTVVAQDSERELRRERRIQEWKTMSKHWASLTYGAPFASWINYGVHIYPDYSISSIEECYSPVRGPVKTAGSFCFQYGWNCDRVFNPFVEVDISPSWSYQTDPVTKIRTNHFSVPVCVGGGTRVMYLNRTRVRLFMTVGLGVCYIPKLGWKEGDFFPSVQFSPFGLEAGSNWFFVFDLGFSAGYIPGRIGFGYKF